MLSTETWNCSKCTFSNHVNNKKCEMCGNPNTMENKSKSNIWTCPQCTFDNSVDYQQCKMCKCSRHEEKANDDNDSLKHEIKHQYEDNQSDDDYCDQEVVVNDKDGRRRAPDFEDKDCNILKCIGYMEMTWTKKNGNDVIKRRECGTGTVFHVGEDGTTFILTCAHNIAHALYCCSNCGNHSFNKKKNYCCPAPDYKREPNLTATEIRFSQRSIHNKYTKQIEDNKQLEVYYGDTEESYLCDINIIFIDNENYNSFPSGSGGYDLAIVKLKKKTQYYKKYVANIRLKIGKETLQKLKEFNIFGFPGDKATNNKQNGLWGMKSLENGMYKIVRHQTSNREYLKQKTVDTYSGTSGACIWIKEEENNYINICGVHTGGKSITKQQNQNKQKQINDEKKKK
eukprot:11000_1